MNSASPGQSLDGIESSARAPSAIRVFVSFDIEHDRELYKRLLAESKASSSEFAVSGSSERVVSADAWTERMHRQIRDANQVIVICGEHTEGSTSVFSELAFAQQEQIPYFLLWGRRELMCTKPVGAKPADGMYSWKRQFLREQIMLGFRRTGPELAARIQRNSTGKR